MMIITASTVRPARSFCLPILLSSLMVLFAIAGPSYAEPFPVPEGARCAECGMAVDKSSKFSSEVETEDGKKLFFCDIGDMLVHFKSSKNKIKNVYVKDYTKGDWTDGRKTYYVLNRKFSTPMSWGIAAFDSESEAKKWGSPADFNGAFRLLK